VWRNYLEIEFPLGRAEPRGKPPSVGRLEQQEGIKPLKQEKRVSSVAF
jgi:hypothetical protein